MYSSTGDFHFSFLYLTDKRPERQTGFIPDPHFAIRLHGKCRMRFSAAGKRLPKMSQGTCPPDSSRNLDPLFADFVNPIQLFFCERDIVHGLDIFLDLFRSRCADQGRADFSIPEDPGEGHLGQ